jgi:hypothetical protein
VSRAAERARDAATSSGPPILGEKGRAVREIQELQIEFPAPQVGSSALMGRARRLVIILGAVLGGIVCAIALSSLLAHPVGATVAPSPQATLPPAAAVMHDTVRSAVSTAVAPVGETASPIVQPLVTVVAPQIAQVLDTGSATLQSLPQTLTQTVSSTVGATTTAVPTAVTSVVTSLVTPLVTPLATPVVGQAAGALGSHASVISSPWHAGPQHGPAFTSRAVHIPPNAPSAPVSPTVPTPPVPFVPSGTTGSGSSPALGSNPLAGHRSSNLQLPTTLSVRLLLGLSRDSGILLDLRHSPPG